MQDGGRKGLAKIVYRSREPIALSLPLSSLRDSPVAIYPILPLIAYFASVSDFPCSNSNPDIQVVTENVTQKKPRFFSRGELIRARVIISHARTRTIYRSFRATLLKP